MKYSLRFRSITAALVVMVLSLTMAACGQKPESTATDPEALASLQQNKYLISDLYGYMTFDCGGNPISWAADLGTASVELFWAGQVFNGKTVVNGDGYSVTEQIFGSVSADGQWLTQLVFSRLIQRTTDYCGYSISLKNVPLISPANSSAIRTIYQKNGDIEKYVEQIQYASAGFMGGAATPTTVYTSTDWSNDSQPPVLTLTFEKTASKPLAGALSSGVGH